MTNNNPVGMTYGSESSKGSFLKNANHALRVIIIQLAT